MPDPSGRALRLRAEDEEDLAVVSACLQDAILRVGDIAYLPDRSRFAFVVNRFRWEGEAGTRVHTGVCFDGVRSVKRRGLRPADPDRLLELLALRSVPGGIEIDFADGVAIRLETGAVRCHVDDLDEPWPTQFRPAHPLEEQDR